MKTVELNNKSNFWLYLLFSFIFICVILQPRDKKPEELFNQTLDCLARSKKEVIDNAIERAKNVAKTLFKTVQNALDMKQIINAGPFVYYIIQEVIFYRGIFNNIICYFL